MENNLPTAEEQLQETLDKLGVFLHKDLKKCIIEDIQEQSKLHTEAALKAASKTIRPEYLAQGTDIVVAKKKILSAYPLTNIQ